MIMRMNLAGRARRLVAAGGLAAVLAAAGPAAAALEVADLGTGLTPENLVQSLVGEGVSVSNVTYTGVDRAAGLFEGGGDILGFGAGVVLGSGDVNAVPGPNDRSVSYINNTPGDPDLDAVIAPHRTFDAAVLEFDFVPAGDSISFEYVFSSEEYPQYVGSSFNDVFAFFVNGENRALVADDAGNMHPVAINTINDRPDVGPPDLMRYYINNHRPGQARPSPDPVNINMSGLTVVLTLTAPVDRGVPNRMKLAIADAGDRILDSNVFIRAGSLRSLEGVAPVGGQLVFVGGAAHRLADGRLDPAENTGNLYVSDLARGRVRPLTDYPAAHPPGVDWRRVILNPSFSPDGRRVLYTAAAGPAADNPRFRVYLAPAGALVADPGRHVLAADPALDFHYAAFSPDFDDRADPPAGAVVYTSQAGDAAPRTDLWRYEPAIGQAALILSRSGLVIRHPVFVAAATIAFIGVFEGVQDIYTVGADGGGLVNLTGNSTPTPRYGRLQSSRRAPGRTPRLIYARQAATGFVYGPWRLRVRTVPAAGTGQGSFVSGIDRPSLHDPCFYGETGSDPEPEEFGLMFYQDNLLGWRGLVQSNYDAAFPGNSDTWRTPRTPDDAVLHHAALPDWGPLPADVADLVAPVSYPLAETRFLLSDGGRLARADRDGDQWRLTVFNTGLPGPEAHPAPDGSGGRLLFEAPQRAGDRLYRAPADGAAVAEHLGIAPDGAAGFAAVSQPAFSACGRFALYLNLAAPGDEAGAVYYASAQVPGGARLIGVVEDAQDASFCPRLARVLYRRTGAGNPAAEGIWLQRVHADHATGTLAALDAVPLTGASAGVTSRQPVFSPDGRHVVFVSDRWGGEDNLFIMEAGRGPDAGRNAVRVALGDNRRPVFGPPGEDPLTWRLAWLRGGEIVTGLVNRRHPGPAREVSETGLFPDPGAAKFAWAPVRAPGAVAARRFLPVRAAAGEPFTYTMTVDIDEAAVPTGFTVSETLPDTARGWTVGAVSIDGTPADPAYASVVDNGDGTQTLRLVFSANPGLPPQHRVADRLIGVTVALGAGAGENRLTGRVSATLAGEPVVTALTGESWLTVGNPPLPVDIYDGAGRRWAEGSPRPAGGHAVGDFDLLFAIDAWAYDARLPGPGGAWPAAVDHWDGIILAVIDIWAGPAGGQGQFVESDGAGVGTADPAGHTGEYAYVGHQRDPANDDPLLNIYTGTYTTGGDPGNSRAGMYWTPGRWTD